MPARRTEIKKTTKTKFFILKLMLVLTCASWMSSIYGADPGNCVTCVQKEILEELDDTKIKIMDDLGKMEKILSIPECNPINHKGHAFYARRGPNQVSDHSTGSSWARKNYITFDPADQSFFSEKNGETSIFNAEAGVYTVLMDGTYIFEFHATKAARWNKDSRSDMSTCIVRLVKEVDNDKGSFTVSTISMGKVVAMDWYSTFAVQLESIVALKKGERIAVRLDDGEILGGWLTTFTGFLIAPEKIPSFCDLDGNANSIDQKELDKWTKEQTPSSTTTTTNPPSSTTTTTNPPSSTTTTTNPPSSTTTTTNPPPSTTTSLPPSTTTNSLPPSTTSSSPQPSTTTKSPPPTPSTTTISPTAPSPTSSNPPATLSTTTPSPPPSTTSTSPPPTPSNTSPSPSSTTTSPPPSTTTTSPPPSTTSSSPPPTPSTTTISPTTPSTTSSNPPATLSTTSPSPPPSTTSTSPPATPSSTTTIPPSTPSTSTTNPPSSTTTTIPLLTSTTTPRLTSTTTPRLTSTTTPRLTSTTTPRLTTTTTSRLTSTATPRTPCNCVLFGNSCKISVPAPANMACKCHSKSLFGFLTYKCYGEVVPCATPGSTYCKNPDKSFLSCLQGKGDCRGYDHQTTASHQGCECDYFKPNGIGRTGGCRIVNPSPANHGCYCHYSLDMLWNGGIV